MGGKDGSPGGGVPAHELWWRVPSGIAAMLFGVAVIMSPLALANFLVNGSLWP